MKLIPIVTTTLAGFGALVTAVTSFSQVATQNPVPSPPAAPSVTASVFTPGFADLMTMLVQPRHLKLYYAGIQKNWELAAFESSSLRAALDRVAQNIPRYRDSGSVSEAVEAMIAPSIKAIDAAIAAGDSKQFVKAYGELTSGCNACHSYTEHPFLVIRVPDVDTKHSNYPAQDFRSRRQ